MCGICGVLNFDGAPILQETLWSMTRSMAYRGPDGEGIWLRRVGGVPSNMTVGLGHRRLAVIDLSSKADQPMTSQGGAFTIVFNGEIYNFKELRRWLQSRGYSFCSESDTEVVLRLYEEIGEKCVEKLDGMFAFAIWDEKRRRLFLARDRAGKKPLYFFSGKSSFLFASEVKVLLRHHSVPADFSVSVLPHFFAFGYPPQGQTFYEGICHLPPAHTLTVNADGSIESRRYWDIDLSGKSEQQFSLPEVSDRVRVLLTEAVRKRLVSDVPLGAFLSGGIDSSIVVGVMSQLATSPVKTFSLGFAGDPSFDETPYARLVASHFQTDHTEFIVEPKAIDLVESLVWHYDGPFGDSSAIPCFIISRLTRQRVTVALNGDGGDELFAGYLRFLGCMVAERCNPYFLRLCSRVLASFPEPKGYHHWLRRSQRFFGGASLPIFDRLRQWVSIFGDDLHKLVRPEILDGGAGTRIGYPSDMLMKTGNLSVLSKILYVNFMTYLPEDLLVKVDRSTMAHGLEARSPLLDYQLTEYLSQVPDHLKLRGTTTKYILRHAFRDLLPSCIFRRGKRGFGVPLGAWFRGELREYLQDTLLSTNALFRDYLHFPYVATLVDEHIHGVRDHGHRLWTLLTFEIWLRQVSRYGFEGERIT